MVSARMERWALFSALTVLVSLLSLALCSAQGGQGGGFGGGGFGGSMGNVENRDLYTTTSILSPGDTNEWPLTVRDGETIIVFVTSTNFDPVAQVVDAAGKLIAENDDVRPGDQNSLLLVHFPRGGKHKILVKAAKSGGAGQFKLTLRRFIATDVKIGARTAGSLGKTGAAWHQFPAEAGQTLVVTVRAASFAPSLEIYAPNGEQVQEEPIAVGERGTERIVFRAATKGVYYPRITGDNRSERDSYALTVAVARVFQTAIGDAAPARNLDAGGLDLWTFKGEAGDVVRVNAKAPGSGVSADMKYLPPAEKPGEQSAPDNAADPLVFLPTDRKSPGELVALLNRAGNYQAAVSQPFGQEIRYTFSTSRAAKAWPQGDEANGKLALGQSDYWAMDGTAGQILRFDGMSEQFDAVLSFYGPRGDMVAANDDGGTDRNALLTALLTERGRYLLRVAAFGDGGGGAYRLRRTLNPVRPLAFGARGQGSVGVGGSEIWSFKGRAGQTIILSARSSDFDTRIAVYGPDGTEVGSDDDGGDGTNSLLEARLPLDGAYTVWVFSKAGSGKYTVHLIEAQ